MNPLWLRLGVAFGVAVVATVALQGWITDADRLARARSPAVPVPAPPTPAEALRLPLSPIPGQVWLATRLEAVAPDVAPVVQVLSDGSLALRRAAPLAADPTDRGHGRAGAAAVLLPAGRLAALNAAQRGALLELVGGWLDERPVPSARLRLVDVSAAPGELDLLLAWVP